MTILRSAAGGVAFGGFLYLVGDTLSDYLTFTTLRAAALQLTAEDEELLQLLGQPYTTGMWYNSTLGFSHRDKVAHCTFQLQGSQRVTDVVVKAGRLPGYQSNILYNIVGPGTWSVLSCQAMVPIEGGLVEPRSLLTQHREERLMLLQQQQQRGRASGGSHPPQHKAGQQQLAGAASSSTTRSWRAWWPWKRSSGDQHSSSTLSAGNIGSG